MISDVLAASAMILASRFRAGSLAAAGASSARIGTVRKAKQTAAMTAARGCGRNMVPFKKRRTRLREDTAIVPTRPQESNGLLSHTFFTRRNRRPPTSEGAFFDADERCLRKRLWASEITHFPPRTPPHAEDYQPHTPVGRLQLRGRS